MYVRNSVSQENDFQLGGLRLKHPRAIVESSKALECRILPPYSRAARDPKELWRGQ